MKRLKNSIKNLKDRGGAAKDRPVGRITNETVAEHREQILAGGRRFKYPVQYTRSTLVRNSGLITLAALLLLVAFGYWQLYPAQNTSRFFYRATQLVPVPVASIDGESVRYSDYLLRVRGALHYLATEDAVNLNVGGGKRQRNYQKRQALNTAEDNAYVAKLARQQKISISNKEVDDFINQQLNSRQPALTIEQFEQNVTRRYYDWSFDEYRETVRDQLLKRKVALAIDSAAKDKANRILQRLRGGADFAAVAREQSDDAATKAQGGDVSFVAKTNDDPDGLIAAASRLQPNQISDVITARDGYYIVKLLENRDKEVRYARIFIKLGELDARLKKLRDDGKVKEYIDVPTDLSSVRQ